jgi:hypothetical protein
MLFLYTVYSPLHVANPNPITSLASIGRYSRHLHRDSRSETPIEADGRKTVDDAEPRALVTAPVDLGRQASAIGGLYRITGVARYVRIAT